MRSDDELRDLFACSALSAMQSRFSPEAAAQQAYQIADAMMAERARRSRPNLDYAGTRWREKDSGEIIRIEAIDDTLYPYWYVREGVSSSAADLWDDGNMQIAVRGGRGSCSMAYLHDRCVQVVKSESEVMP